FDARANNDRFSNFLTAGFYYKTFMWPKAFWEKVYEPIIRKAAGLGSLSLLDDPDVYDKGFLHCDLLVIGAGPAGLMAALTAGRSGANVILADEDFSFGGRLNSETFGIGDDAGAVWAAGAVAELASLPNVCLMVRTTVIGAFDHGIYGAVERVSDHVAVPDAGKPRQILWRIYTQRTVLAAGAIERPIAFENNDRPGIMLGSAIRTYANRYGVAADKRIAIFTNNDDGHRTAADLHAKGVKIAAVVDVRADAPRSMDFEVLHGQVIDTKGRLGLTFADVKLADGTIRTLDIGALGMSGGWNPNVHMTCHQRGRPTWNADLAAFVPGGTLPDGMIVAGAANGDMSTAGALRGGALAARAALG
ncbi:MAG: FAD-dependent oxidoreductase, partial [Octadecabacter sp.]